MKKIYLTISTVALFIGANAQQHFMSTVPSNNKQSYIRKGNTVTEQKISRTSAGAIQGRFDPGFSLITARGVIQAEIGGGTSGTKVGSYVSPTFCDSTVRSSFPSSTRYISTIKFGTTFDPKSIIYDQTNFTPLLSSTDSYYVDTLWIGGVYIRKNSAPDTLLVEMVWGDTTNTTVFGAWSYAGNYGYLGRFATPKYTTKPTQLQGSAAFLSAPVSNKLTIKYLLTDADTATLGQSNYLPIVVNGLAGQFIPADNIVSTNVTFISGEATYSVGTCVYSPSTGSVAATANGFAAIQYAQNSPTLTSSGFDYFDDFGQSKNYSTVLTGRGRYGTDSFTAFLRGAIGYSFWIDYSIHTTTVTTSVNELNTKGFSLGQNTPNPYNGSSVASYSLVKEATSALFTVTDVMGRVLTSQKVNTTTGTHAVTLGAYAAGIYYYSLQVDGKSTTQKMIVE